SADGKRSMRPMSTSATKIPTTMRTSADMNDHSSTTQPFIPGASARCAPTRPEEWATSSNRSLTDLDTRRCYLPTAENRLTGELDVSAGETAHSRDPLVGPVLAQTAQTSHEHRVVLERLLGVDQSTEQLVVARRTHPEGAANR